MTSSVYVSLFIFSFLAVLTPRLGLKIFRKGLLEDLFYFALLEAWAPITAIILFTIGHGFIRKFYEGTFNLQGQQLWLQLLVCLILLDFFSYWIHRAFHSFEWLWNFHKTHHSANELTCLTAHRVHPFEEVIFSTLVILPIYILKLDSSIVPWVYTINLFQGHWIHSDTKVKIPLFENWFVTPHFHLWHHSESMKYRDGQNFSSVFSIWDRIFGTYWMPAEIPEKLGFVGMEKLSRNPLKMLAHPLNFALQKKTSPDRKKLAESDF